MKLSTKQLHKKNTGFTLTEMLAVVALVAILVAAALVGVGRLRRNLRQRELDSKAEIIYMAAQSRITQLRTGGFGDLYGKDRDGVHKDIYPLDAEENSEDAANLYYVLSEENSDTAYVLLPESSVERDLWMHNWLIEFNPNTGSIYAVFYSEESIADFAGADPMTRLDALRVKSERLEDGAWIGYYGGDLTHVDAVDPDAMRAEVVIVNKEKLTAYFYCHTLSSEKPSFTVTITDCAGNKFTRQFAANEISQDSGTKFSASWVLDSLDAGGSFYTQTQGKLLCGTKIDVRLDTSLQKAGGKLLTDKDIQSTNSLFDYRSNDNTVAYIAYGRHLQNLDNNTSQVETNKTASNMIRSAIQVDDISFLENDADPECFYSVYGDRLFQPIHNSSIHSYAGQKIGSGESGSGGIPAISGLHIETTDNRGVGLFSSFTGTIQDLLVTGPRVLGGGSNVGVLVGASSGKTQISHVQVFLSTLLGDLDRAGTAGEVAKVKPWLQGRNAGGLIGTAGSNGELTIHHSSVSLPMSATRYMGGLVGMVNCPVNIYNCYTDCYLTGASLGGLIGGAGGRARINLQNFYTAGYGLAENRAAGWVVFEENVSPLKNATNGYSAMSLELTGDSDTEEADRRIYTTAYDCVNATRAYYLPLANTTDCRNSQVEAISYEVLTGIEALERLQAPFALGTSGQTYPYNLMDQGLSTYSFPKLGELDHYGDWSAKFEEGALVYFEKDQDGNLRFEGGNISVDNIRADDTIPDYADRVRIRGDGYALAYLAEKSDDWKAVVKLGNNTATLTNQNRVTVTTQSGQTYYLYRLPADMLNNDANVQSGSFYQQLSVRENDQTRYYYFNPNFASCFGSSLEGKPSVLHLRSPRHLYALSRLYPQYRGLLTAASAVWQDLDLSYGRYDWEGYYGQPFLSQEPIGSETDPYFITYDGRNHVIEGLDIESSANQVGLFGKVSASGSIRNLVLIGERTGGTAHTVAHMEKDSRPIADGVKTVNMGALVGWNQGSLSNCAVTGYRMGLSAYNGATVNIGGLVGRNDGGTLSACSAETPTVSLRSYNANIYAAGLVGDNSGSVYNSYAAGYLEVTESRLNKNTVRIAGFAAKNGSGNLIRCYAGVALMGSGDTEMYGFACTGGATIGCYYLDGGTYAYRGKIYSLNASENAFRATARGSVTDAQGLANMKLDGFGSAPNTYLGNADGQTYPYPASLTRNGQAMHFGPWPNQDKDVGEFGVFYWEYEQGGNSGYHLSFQGTSNGEVMEGGSTLCTAHDDGGVITMYGYGYFYKPTANTAPEDDPKRPTLVPTNCELGDEDTNASRELEIQMPQYKFVAYRTGVNGLHMTGKDGNRDTEANRNAAWTLYSPYVTHDDGSVDTAQSGVYTYTVSPFFANAFSLDGISQADLGDARATGAARPGSQGNSYEVRSVEQLQFINWNYWAKNASSYISATDRSKNDNLYNRYPYLSYGKYGTNDNRPSARLDLYWVQSHDLNAAGTGGTYTPIGGMYDNAGNTGNAQATMAFFSSSYDGQAYTIRNISIDTDAQCIGVFGATSGAKMKNIVLYSDNDAKIIHRDSKSWYSVGGLVGLAGSGNDPDSTFTNCTVSGYSILDVQATNPGWGGGCVGGMVGATTMKITNCSAVTDIEINITYNGPYQNLRVGGMVGCARGSIVECYAGGSMKSTSNISQGGFSGSASIWMGGILGGIILRNGGNLASLIGSTTVATTVTDSYSYVSMPAKGSNGIKSTQAIASNGEMQEGFSNVQNDYIVITNCYALDSSAQKADDYKLITYGQLKGTATFQGVNLNATHYASGSGKDWWHRRIELNNDRNPYLSYSGMQEALFGYLPDFRQVTTTENTASINGKYSFPGSDIQLKGLDYPFPTVLTQENNGETVNVHYGRWPKFGIYWQEHQATMDLLANRGNTAAADGVAEEVAEEAELLELPPEETEETGSPAENEQTEPRELIALQAETLQATLDWRLYVAGVDTSGISEPVYTLMDQEGNPVPEAEVSKAAASILTYDRTLTGDYFGVTFLGQHPGTVKVLATVTQKGVDYTALLTLTVTADLKIAVDETLLPLKAYEGDGLAELKVLLEDAGGNAFRPGENAKLSWDLAIDTQDSEKDLVTWTKDGFLNAKEDGSFTLTGLTGFSAGEGALSLRLTYTWDAGDGVNADPVESTLVIPVVIHPSDVLGLGDGITDQEVTLPHRPADGEFTSEARAEGKGGPELESAKLFLYASNRKGTDGSAISYTDLSQFDVEKAELNLGGSYREMTKVLPDTTAPEPAADSFTLDGITVSVDRTVVTTGTRNQNFVYRPVTVTGDSDAQWSLRLTLRPRSSDGTAVNRTYTLVYDRPNYVRFCFQSEETQTLLKQVRVEQGQDLSKLDQDELDGELLQLAKNAGLDAAAGLAEGYHWTWRLPEGTVTENRTILQEAGPIRFYVAYDAGYDDYEWDDNVPMENSVFIYDSSANTLKECEYQRPGYEFAGWAGQGGATFVPGPFTDRLDTLTGGQKIEQGQIVTLRALWTPASYTVTYNGNFPGWDSPDGEAGTMEASRYSIGTGDRPLPDCGFTRSGYRFLGWAFEADAAQAALTQGATLEDAMKQGGSHILYQDVTLYAVWEQEEGDQKSQEDGTQEQEDLEEGGDTGQKEPILPETPEQPAEGPEDKKQEPAEEANRNETEA